MSRKYYVYFMQVEEEENVLYLVICPKDYWDTKKFIPDFYILSEDIKYDEPGAYPEGTETDDEILELLKSLELDEVGDWEFEKYLEPYDFGDEDKISKELYKKLIDSGLCEFSEIFIKEMNDKFPNREKIYLP